MATKWYNIKGRLYWAQVYEPDDFMGAQRWKVSFEPFSEEEKKKFLATGIEVGAKPNADGIELYTLRRDVRKVFPKDDEATYYTPPELTGAVNISYVNAATKQKVKTFKKSDKIEIEMVGDKVSLGNGTVGIVNLSIFDTQKGKGHRLEGIKILDLVEYEKNEEQIKVNEEPDEDAAW